MLALDLHTHVAAFFGFREGLHADRRPEPAHVRHGRAVATLAPLLFSQDAFLISGRNVMSMLKKPSKIRSR